MAILHAHFLAQGIVDPFECTVLTPALEMFPYIGVRRKVMWQVTPRTPGAQLKEDGIPNLPQRIRARSTSSSPLCGRKHFFYYSPFGIGQV